jgi:flagellar biosynthesis protein FlhG
VAKARFISILSGKGGVGKSVLAMNLADQLTALGYRVLLVDADFSLGSIHVLANVASDRGVNEYVTGAMTLAQAVTSTRGIDLLVATWNRELVEERSIQRTAQLLASLRADTTLYDFVIFDHGSGRSDQAVLLAHASDSNVLVVIPELTSLADAYGLFKQIVTAKRRVEGMLLVNRAQSKDEAEYIRTRMSELTGTFLRESIGYLGYVSEDNTFRQSVASQLTLLQASPDSVACKQLRAIAQSISQMQIASPRSSEGTSQLIINKTSATADIRG